MKRTLCYCSPAYGAMMHALPRDASALKRMTEQQMVDQAKPWINRVPPQTEHQLDTWTVKAVNPIAKGLGDLGDLSELSGLKKKLKKVAKKIAKPLAYAIGGATGTLALVAKADRIRTAARKVRAMVKGGGDAPAEAQPPEQPAPQYQTEAPQQAAPVYQPQYATQQSFAPVQPQYTPPAPRPAPAPAPAPVQYEQPTQPTFAPAQADPFANFNNVQRLAPASDEQEDKPKIVGISTAGIMQSIKANPIPWTVGGLGLGFILYRAMNPSQPQRAY